MSGCCNESGCRRSKPMMLSRGGLSGAWYVVTDYVERGPDQYEARQRHQLPDDVQAQLTAAFDALDAAPSPNREPGAGTT